MIKRVLITAGGTGGHVFPGVAVAEGLREKGIEVAWLGTSRGIESDIVKKANIPFYCIAISGVRGKNMFKRLQVVFQLVYGVLKAIKIIYRYQPDIVIGMGGYAAGAGGIAAWLLRKKLILHEQNSVAGITNKFLSHFAKKVLTGFPVVTGLKKIIYTGNPIRQNIIDIESPEKRYFTGREKLNLLILGGSQGAKIFNDIVPKSLEKMSENTRPSVWHIAGKKHIEAADHVYKQAQVGVRLDAFIDDMAKAYAWADLVICRAGALTVSEISAAGVAAVFVPFPHAVDDHQTKNAEFLSAQQAAILLPQENFTIDSLFDLLNEFISDKQRLIDIALKAWQLRVVDSVEKIFKELESA